MQQPAGASVLWSPDDSVVEKDLQRAHAVVLDGRADGRFAEPALYVPVRASLEKGAQCGDIVEFRGLMQGRVAAAIPNPAAGTVVEQYGRRFDMAGFHGLAERCFLERVRAFDIRTVSKQQLQCFDLSFLGCIVQQGVAPSALNVRVRAPLKKQRGRIEMIPFERPLKRRFPVVVLRIDLQTPVKEEGERFAASARCRNVQRGAASPRSCAEVGPVIEKQFHDLDATGLHREVQRSPSIAVEDFELRPFAMRFTISLVVAFAIHAKFSSFFDAPLRPMILSSRLSEHDLPVTALACIQNGGSERHEMSPATQSRRSRFRGRRHRFAEVRAAAGPVAERVGFEPTWIVMTPTDFESVPL